MCFGWPCLNVRDVGEVPIRGSAGSAAIGQRCLLSRLDRHSSKVLNVFVFWLFSRNVEFLNLFKPSTFFGSVQCGQFCQRITNLNNSIVNLNFVKRVSYSQLFPLLAISAQLIVRVLVTGLLGPASVVMVDFSIFDPNAGKTVRTPGEPSFLYFSFNIWSSRHPHECIEDDCWSSPCTLLTFLEWRQQCRESEIALHPQDWQCTWSKCKLLVAPNPGFSCRKF
jgi:hypothetical protein